MNLPSILSPDFGLLFWMLLAFLIVFALLAKYGFPVIINMVNERKGYIDESLKNAREANERLANVKADCERLLREAREQQAQILKEAMTTRDGILEKARSEARSEGIRLLDEAKAQIAVEKENAMRDIRSTVADLSVTVAERVVRRQLDKAVEDEDYVDRLFNEIK